MFILFLILFWHKIANQSKLQPTKIPAKMLLLLKERLHKHFITMVQNSMWKSKSKLLNILRPNGIIFCRSPKVAISGLMEIEFH